jgi:hypothetical protein
MNALNDQMTLGIDFSPELRFLSFGKRVPSNAPKQTAHPDVGFRK